MMTEVSVCRGKLQGKSPDRLQLHIELSGFPRMALVSFGAWNQSPQLEAVRIARYAASARITVTVIQVEITKPRLVTTWHLTIFFCLFTQMRRLGKRLDGGLYHVAVELRFFSSKTAWPDVPDASVFGCRTQNGRKRI
jgi:hypothetical protein